MLLSMTGFATQSIELTSPDATVVVTIQIKSLNAKFFEASCKLPYAFAHLETAIIKKLRDALTRGTIYCTVYLNSSVALSSRPVPALAAIEGYLQAMATIQETFGAKYKLTGTPDLNTIVQLPHVFDFADQPIPEEIVTQLLAGIDEVVVKLTEQRALEGDALRAEMHKRLEMVEETIKIVKVRAAEVVEEKRKKFLADLQLMLETASAETKDHHMQLIYNQLDKLDITEEVVRLANHLTNAQAILKSTKIEKGKQLDFTLQEMFREINTLGSKCADAILSNLAITIKVELEKAREQVQNIV